MKRYHSPHHWIPVAIVVAIALLTLSNAHGQRTDSSAMFEGRPAMAGAQAGTGAMAGPPQGGIAPQGQDNPQISVQRRSTAQGAEMPPPQVGATNNAAADQRAVRNDKDVVKRDRDSGIAKDQRSAARKVKDAIKRLVNRTRHGVDDVQTANQK
jgi:hypothetical protein